jgi:hypothetical protein
MPCHVPSGCCSLAIYFGMHAAPDRRPGAWLAGSRRVLVGSAETWLRLESLRGRRDGDEQERVARVRTSLPGRAAFVCVARARPRQAWRGALTRGLAGKRDEGLGWAGSCFWQWRSVGVGLALAFSCTAHPVFPQPGTLSTGKPKKHSLCRAPPLEHPRHHYTTMAPKKTLRNEISLPQSPLASQLSSPSLPCITISPPLHHDHRRLLNTLPLHACAYQIDP